MSKNKFYKTEKFKDLQNEWAAKLKDSGFVDIETGDSEYSVEGDIVTKGKENGGLSYRDQCIKILNNFVFRTAFERKVFELHAEGKSEDEIKSYLKRYHKKSITRQTVNNIINRIKKESENVLNLDEAAEMERLKSDYYRLCDEILNHHDFRFPFYRLVFAYHHGGMTDAQIVAHLVSAHKRRTTPDKVREVIEKVKREYLEAKSKRKQFTEYVYEDTEDFRT